MGLPDLSNLDDMMKQMQDAYSEGADVMNKAGKEAAKEMNPDHEIEVDVSLKAKIEGNDYEVDAAIIFNIELEPILSLSGGSKKELSEALDNLDVDLGDDKSAVMKQLGQPRAIGAVKKIDTKKLEISNKEGKVKTNLNKDGTILATLKGKKLQLNFESVLSYPDHNDVFVAIPSMEKMQKNIVIDLEDLNKTVDFKWIEKDKDNLQVSGKVKISKK
ncbi:hypothetical protein JW978_03475 [Candidatus Dojkabacteria bacterium]|nr:hypothetical protein [Candidatus Dojkabacteria bacterium]